MASAEKETVQPINVNDKEIELIKNTFDEDILKMIRALWLGLSISDSEKTVIQTLFRNADLFAILKRRLYPELDRNMPIGQVQDAWMGVEKQVFAENPNTIYQAVHYKVKALELTAQALELLKNPFGEAMNITFVPPTGPMADLDVALQVELLGRNQYIRHIEQQLLFLWLISQQKVEKPAEVAVKKGLNSNK